MRALVVDDSKAIRNILRRYLTELTFEVCEASNGREAVDVLGKASSVDVVLVDWNMPEMDGLGFIRAVRAKPSLKDLRVVVVTTETDVGHVAAALEAGAQGYVLKPLTKEQLQGKLAAVGLPVPSQPPRGASSEARP